VSDRGDGWAVPLAVPVAAVVVVAALAVLGPCGVVDDPFDKAQTAARVLFVGGPGLDAAVIPARGRQGFGDAVSEDAARALARVAVVSVVAAVLFLGRCCSHSRTAPSPSTASPDYRPICRPITSCWISLVPSPISISLASR
jgi:hypothetical protein